MPLGTQKVKEKIEKIIKIKINVIEPCVFLSFEARLCTNLGREPLRRDFGRNLSKFSTNDA